MLQKTTTEVITDRIILEAKRMLMDKKFTVNEIASELGYDDYSYFSRLFKMCTIEFDIVIIFIKGISYSCHGCFLYSLIIAQ